MIEVEEQNTTDSASRDVAVNELASHLGVRAERGRRFAELTSLRVGGAIDWVLSPLDETAAASLVHELDQREIAWRALGSGSNVLADDGEHHYVIVSLKELKAHPVFNGNLVSVSAGYSLPRLCIDAARQGLSGIEGLNGIPGTVGGALWMNAGAYGQEIGTVKMIDDLGLKGTRRGGATVSPKHANFIVTEGEEAKAADALALAEEIRERVKREHGIDLEYEVELWSSK